MEIKEVNEKYLNKIYLNILKAIIIVTYFLILNLAYEKLSNQYIEIGTKIFTMIFLFIAIYIFERAYKRDDGDLAIQGIEILVLSAYTLTTKHITNKFDFDFKNYSLVASYIYAIYFIFKGIVIYTKGRKEFADNLSDIREIVKKDEPTKKEATKKKVESNEKEEMQKTNTSQKSNNNKIKKENNIKSKKIITQEKTKTKRIKKEVKEND